MTGFLSQMLVVKILSTVSVNCHFPKAVSLHAGTREAQSGKAFQVAGTYLENPLPYLKNVNWEYPLTTRAMESCTTLVGDPRETRDSSAEMIRLVLNRDLAWIGRDRLIFGTGSCLYASSSRPKCLDLELERCRYNFTDPYYSHAVWGSSGTRSDINTLNFQMC